ncbi:unnamed protein product [Anisakis simplex]|uniref:Uncharacterized protein n=1 Tax=Anisakis simplex TaxID=6269 RepID=A0A0M3JZ28_ANISI|nr:unnamed protein product [Anisakis simplex]
MPLIDIYQHFVLTVSSNWSSIVGCRKRAMRTCSVANEVRPPSGCSTAEPIRKKAILGVYQPKLKERLIGWWSSMKPVGYELSLKKACA